MTNFRNVLKNMFPFISAAASLGGPLGAMAVQAVGRTLGIENVGNTDEQLSDAITAAQIRDPEALMKLKAAEAEFQLEMSRLGYDTLEKLEGINAEDRANARAREIAIRDNLPAILALLVTMGFFALLAILAFKDIPNSSETILNIMVGSLGTAWAGIISYYFGSSAGSSQKSVTIANLAEEAVKSS